MGDESKPSAPEAANAATLTGETGAAVPSSGSPPEDWATRFKYLYADFENFRRRAERERESLTRQSRGAMLRELLPIIEAFHGAARAAAELPGDHPLRRGIELLDREWSTFLKHEGVEPIARVGGTFRPEEAVAVGDSSPSTEAPDGAIAEIVQQGYRFFGGILRPAKVIVARSPNGTSVPVEPRE